MSVSDALTRPSPQRIRIMRAIRGSGNRTTELTLVAAMRASELTGWRRKQNLPGHPDFVFRRKRLAVFVDGCFWHGCPRCYRVPRTNSAFWQAKIQANRKRDARVSRNLRKQGWRVLRIWEHSLAISPESVTRRLKARLSLAAPPLIVPARRIRESRG
jgi:DNA mismatch endonuclease, patch repair protein